MFVERLRQLQMPIACGEVVVEAAAGAAGSILQVIRDLELPLTITFNRGRLRVLPAAVSKATGLRELLSVMRLSPHNTLVIGDAENDHDFLASCEVGAAVAWDSPGAAGDCRSDRRRL